LGSIRVDVWNGATILCASDKTTTALVKLGFDATNRGNYDGAYQLTSVIQYPAALAGQANTLHGFASQVPLVPTADVTTLTLVVGADGATVNGLDFTTSPATCDAAAT
jgi:LytR cell envelope-related transcriptional attenuator